MKCFDRCWLDTYRELVTVFYSTINHDLESIENVMLLVFPDIIFQMSLIYIGTHTVTHTSLSSSQHPICFWNCRLTVTVYEEICTRFRWISEITKLRARVLDERSYQFIYDIYLTISNMERAMMKTIFDPANWIEIHIEIEAVNFCIEKTAIGTFSRGKMGLYLVGISGLSANEIVIYL